MKILAISTSTPRGSAALLDAEHALDVGGAKSSDALGRAPADVLSTAVYVDLQGHAERIFAAIDEALDAAGTSRMALDAIACDVGPGSFTGVRVAIAAAKGIALALDVPALGISSLEAMAAPAFAEGAASTGDLLVSMIDAKKGEVFLAAFAAPEGPPMLPPQHVPRDAVLDAIATVAGGRRIVVVGEIAEELAPLSPHRLMRRSFDLPDASWIGRLAMGRIARGGCLREHAQDRAVGHHDPALLEALYVRAPDAKPAELG